jgi:peroxiredoxin
LNKEFLTMICKPLLRLSRAAAWLLAASTLVPGLTLAAPGAVATVGQPAPAFTATDLAGKTVSLADFKGKTVVLEWVNPGCPYVRKHYDSGNLPANQREATAQGVVWLAINSTTKSHEDYLAPNALASWMSKHKAAPSATLMDEPGSIGRAYGARTTPHMYIVDAKGVLVYAGAIDNKPSSNPADIPTATNHVKVALADLKAGRPPSAPITRPYGCSVKYASGV